MLIRQDQEDVEHPEGGGWDDKKIHGDEVLGMGVEESLPGLVAASGSGAILAKNFRTLRQPVVPKPPQTAIRLLADVGAAPRTQLIAAIIERQLRRNK